MGLYIQAQIGDDKYILYPSEDQPVLLDISSIENGEIGELLGDLSQDFQIPATEENNRFFQHAFEVGHQDIPGVYNSVEVTLNNEEQTLFQGSMTLKEWDEAEGIYTCAIESSIINLKDRLDGLELQRAPGWDAYDHTYNMQAWERTNTVDELNYDFLDYFYPVIDYGYDDEGRSRFVSNEDIDSGQRPTSTGQVYQSQTTPGQAGDLYGDTFNLADRNALWYPNSAGNLEAAEKIITSSPWFGEVSQSSYPLQGFISHPSTPLRIEQLKPAIKLSTCLDRVFELANLMDVDGVLVDRPGVTVTYEAPFLDMQKDVFVLPNLDGKEGIIATTENVNDNFVARQSNVAGINIDKGSTSGTNETDITQYTFGDGTVTQTFGKSANLDTGTYVVPNPGTYEFSFTGGFTVTSTDLVDDAFVTQFVTPQVVVWINDVIVQREQLERIVKQTPTGANNEREWDITYTGNLKVGDRVDVGLISARHKGHREVDVTMTDWEFQTGQVAKDWTMTNVQLGRQFMDTSALDFLKGVVQKQNLVIYKDKTRRNHYIIRQYNDWILGGQLIEWSDRVGPLVQSNLLSEQPRTVVFADSESDDRFNKESIDKPTALPYATEKYDSTDTGITDGDTDIGDFFAPTIPGSPTRASDFEKQTNPTVAGIPQMYEFDDNTKKIIDTGIHIGYTFCTSALGKFYYAVGDTSIAYNDVVRTLSNVNEERKRNFNWKNEVSDGTLPQSAYDLYWSQYINHLYENNNVKVSTTVLLSPSEYQTLNINDTVHINGNDYLINKISGFNLTEPAEVDVELISYSNNFTNVYEEPTIRYIDPTDPDIRTAIVGIQVIGTRTVDGAQVPWDIPVLQQDMTQIRLEGEFGTSVTETLRVARVPGYDLSATNFNAVDLPSGVTFVPRDVAGGDIEFDVTVVIQPEHTFDYLELRGQVDEIVSGDQTVDINVTSGTTGLVVQNGSISQFGAIGTRSTFRVYLSVPDTTMQVEVASIMITSLPVGLDFVSRTDFGTGAELIFSGLITNEGGVAAVYNVEITGTLESVGGGAEIVTHTITFQEALAYQSVSIAPSQIQYTGAVGEQHDFTLNIAPASGYETSTPWNFTDTAFANDLTSIQDGYGVVLPVRLTTPGETDPITSTVMVNGRDASLIGATTFTNTIMIQAAGSTFNYGDRTLEVKIVGVPDATGIFQLDVTPEELFSFNDLDTLTFSAGGVGLVYDSVSLVGNSLIVNFIYTIGSEDTDATISHNNGVADMEDFSLKFIINNVGLDRATFSPGEFNLGYTAMTAGSTIGTQTVTVTPTSGAFSDSSQVTVSQNNTSETLPGVNYDTTTPVADNGVITFDITGEFPDYGGQHVVTIDVSGAPVLSPATVGAFTQERYYLPLTGGLLRTGFTANGTIDVIASSSQTAILPVDDEWLKDATETYTNNTEGNGSADHVMSITTTTEARTAYWLMFGTGDRTTILDYLTIDQSSLFSTTPATSASLRSLSPGISSAGGTAVFELVVNGAWNANLTVATQDGEDEDNDTGSFDIDVGPAGNLPLLNVKGAYSPTFGGEGTHLITLETGPEPIYFKPGGPSGALPYTVLYSTTGPTYVIYIHARNTDGTDGALLIGNNVRQNQDNGGRLYTLPPGWSVTDNGLLTASTTKDTWTFYT